jgi:hypothetical protein
MSSNLVNQISKDRYDEDSDEEGEDDDDSSSGDEADNSGGGQRASNVGPIFDRDSMVLVGENVTSKKKSRLAVINKSGVPKNDNPILIASEEDGEEEKQKLLSDLESHIDMEEEDVGANSESIFKSR